MPTIMADMHATLKEMGTTLCKSSQKYSVGSTGQELLSYSEIYLLCYK